MSVQCDLTNFSLILLSLTLDFVNTVLFWILVNIFDGIEVILRFFKYCSQVMGPMSN